jgi:antitoxin ParD1/3/4
MPAKLVRSVSLTSELTALIDEKIATGHYRSASEVVRAALRLLAEQDRRRGRNLQRRATGGHDAR